MDVAIWQGKTLNSEGHLKDLSGTAQVNAPCPFRMNMLAKPRDLTVNDLARAVKEVSHFEKQEDLRVLGDIAASDNFINPLTLIKELEHRYAAEKIAPKNSWSTYRIISETLKNTAKPGTEICEILNQMNISTLNTSAKKEFLTLKRWIERSTPIYDNIENRLDGTGVKQYHEYLVKMNKVVNQHLDYKPWSDCLDRHGINLESPTIKTTRELLPIKGKAASIQGHLSKITDDAI